MKEMIGERMECKRCGREIIRKGANQKVCRDCNFEINKEMSREREYNKISRFELEIKKRVAVCEKAHNEDKKSIVKLCNMAINSIIDMYKYGASKSRAGFNKTLARFENLLEEIDEKDFISINK